LYPVTGEPKRHIITRRAGKHLERRERTLVASKQVTGHSEELALAGFGRLLSLALLERGEVRLLDLRA
jgi:hypothetical protein